MEAHKLDELKELLETKTTNDDKTDIYYSLPKYTYDYTYNDFDVPATVKELGLTNVEIIQGRAEEQKQREKYDIVTARAVKELNILLELCFYLVKIGGMFIAYKSSGIDEEILNAKHAFKCLEISSYQKFDYFLPKSKNSRVFLGILKKNKTPKKYPRRYAEIIKSPL